MTMSYSFSLENYLWAFFEALDDGGFFQWGFMFALAVPGTTISSWLFLGSSRLCEFVNPHEGYLLLQLIRGIPFLYSCFLWGRSCGIYSYTKGSSFYQSSGIWVSYLIPQVGSGLWLLFFHISWGHGNQGWDWWGLANALSVLFTSGFLHSPRVRLNNFFLTFLWCF